MKAKIFEIKRFAVHDGDGIRTTVFFKGCPLKCVWCHNPEGIGFEPQLAYYENKCIACAECVSVCPTGAHSVKTEHFFEREKCIACGKCAAVCPKGIIDIIPYTHSIAKLLFCGKINYRHRNYQSR